MNTTFNSLGYVIVFITQTPPESNKNLMGCPPPSHPHEFETQHRWGYHVGPASRVGSSGSGWARDMKRCSCTQHGTSSPQNPVPGKIATKREALNTSKKSPVPSCTVVEFIIRTKQKEAVYPTVRSVQQQGRHKRVLEGHKHLGSGCR